MHSTCRMVQVNNFEYERVAKIGKKLYCDANNGKKENGESPSNFSKLAKVLDFLNRGQADPSATPILTVDALKDRNIIERKNGLVSMEKYLAILRKGTE